MNVLYKKGKKNIEQPVKQLLLKINTTNLLLVQDIGDGFYAKLNVLEVVQCVTGNSETMFAAVYLDMNADENILKCVAVDNYKPDGFYLLDMEFQKKHIEDAAPEYLIRVMVVDGIRCDLFQLDDKAAFPKAKK